MVNPTTHVKLVFCPKQNIEEQLNQMLSQKVFPIFEWQVICSAEFVEYINGKEEIIRRLIKSNMFL